MNNGVIFIAGVYGVGKSTICNNLNKSLGIPAYSSSKLISEINGEKYGCNKSVNDKVSNQHILINSVEQYLKEDSYFILDGHFCILDKQQNVEVLPEFVFRELHLCKIILLDASVDAIICNLNKRDNKVYSIETIKNLKDMEYRQAKKLSEELNIPLIIHNVHFNEEDTKILSRYIEDNDKHE